MWSALEACPFAWFLSRHAGADPPTGSTPAFGSVVHAVADAVARGELTPEPQPLEAAVRQVWPMLNFEAEWQRESELREAVAALTRFAKWHLDRRDRQLVASEAAFETPVTTAAGPALLRGRIDRLERGVDGLHVIDLKTQRRPVPASDMLQHRQLALYQLAASSGALDAGQEGDPLPVANAELVQLRLSDPKTGGPRVQIQTQVELPAILGDLAAVVARVRGEDFAPAKGPACRYCAFGILCPTSPAGREVGS